MAEHNHHSHHQQEPSAENTGIKLDAASKSLYEAFRISFVILKVIMIVLVVLFIASGFRTVLPDEQALVLQFGKIRGMGENRILKAGPHWVFPYPVEEMIRIPVGKKTSMAINSFWFYKNPKDLSAEGPRETKYAPPTLDPTIDGYCITRGEKQSTVIAGVSSSDYGIVHCKWQLIYQIDDPERFFRNFYVRDVKPGENYFDVIVENIQPLLQNLVEDAVVSAMVNYTIDEAISSYERIPLTVDKLLQQKLDGIESGINVTSLQLTEVTWPRQVDAAFQASIAASQQSQTAINEARTYAENTLNQAAGPIAPVLLSALEDKTVSDEKLESLWNQADRRISGKNCPGKGLSHNNCRKRPGQRGISAEDTAGIPQPS